MEYVVNKQVSQFYYIQVEEKLFSRKLLTNELDGEVERLRVELAPENDETAIKDISTFLTNCSGSKIVIEVARRTPSKKQLVVAKQLRANGAKVWLYWLDEQAAEYADDFTLQEYTNVLYFSKAIDAVKLARGKINSIKVMLIFIVFRTRFYINFLKCKSRIRKELNQPRNIVSVQSGCLPKDYLLTEKKTAIYLRLDYWNKGDIGGSYSHMSFVISEMVKKGIDVYFIGTKHYDSLAELGVKQITLDCELDGNYEELLYANEHYYSLVKQRILEIKPDFIYERFVQGSYVGAKIAHDSTIPFLLEYNGWEMGMMSSSQVAGNSYIKDFIAIEKYVFDCANMITAVSTAMAQDLMDRGVSKDKLLINPNGADPSLCYPGTIDNKTMICEQLQWPSDAIIVGYISTFGPWHGSNVIANILKPIIEKNEKVRFMFIGQGDSRHYIDDKVIAEALQDKVKMFDTIPLSRAAPYMQACDILLSPQLNSALNTAFFGSPIKLFEYMALGKAIIASDLMQIGEVLRPALLAKNLNSSHVVTTERAILTNAGSQAQLKEAILFLAEYPDIRVKLGANARCALIQYYSWEKNVNRLFAFVTGDNVKSYMISDLCKKTDNTIELSSLDKDKFEIQNQWNNDPCGSHYAGQYERKTLQWYVEVENYRYNKYAPWMKKTMGFTNFTGKKVLEVGGGLGTDLCQYAKHGAETYDVDFSITHLNHARENFALRGLKGYFCLGDGENLPYPDSYFDVIYSNGVIHHSPDTQKMIDEMYRVLKPGGVIKIMVYARNSWQFWVKSIKHLWLRNPEYSNISINEVLSQTVEISESSATPLVKVYSAKKLKSMFAQFEHIKVQKRQLEKSAFSRYAQWLPVNLLQYLIGWNLIVTAVRPAYEDNKVNVQSQLKTQHIGE